MSIDENNVSLDLPELQPIVSEYEKAVRVYEKVSLEYYMAKNAWMKISHKYVVIRTHPNISKALHNYAKFHDKPVDTVPIMDLITSSAGVEGWVIAFDHEHCLMKD